MKFHDKRTDANERALGRARRLFMRTTQTVEWSRLLLAGSIVVAAGCGDAKGALSATVTIGPNADGGSGSGSGTASSGSGSGTASSGSGSGSSAGTTSSGSSAGTPNSGSSAGTASSGSGSGTASGVLMTVSPSTVALAPAATQTFVCSVTGASSNACTWSVAETAGGSISSAGLYSAPSTNGTYHIVATSVADPKSSASATVTVPLVPVGGCQGTSTTAGTWQNITPTQLNGSQWCIPGATNCPGSAGSISTYGANGFIIDPTNLGTVYLGTAGLGIWKSTDCGQDWAKIDTGTNSAALDAGRNHIMFLDPTNSKVLYSTALYNSMTEGIYQSIDGGVNWNQIVSADVLAATAAGFFSAISLDPTDRNHIVASPHISCSGTPLSGAILADASVGGGWGCLADGHFVNGAWQWKLTTNGTVWGNSDGGAIQVLGGNRWIYGGASTLLLTTTGGVPPAGGGPGSAWTSVYPAAGQSVAYTSGVFYTATDGTIYSGGPSVIYSTDNGSTWTPTDSLGGSASSYVDDGTTLYVSTALYGDQYYTSPLSASNPALKFTMMPTIPQAVWGGFGLGYDPNFHILYSTNLTGGFWRYFKK